MPQWNWKTGDGTRAGLKNFNLCEDLQGVFLWGLWGGDPSGNCGEPIIQAWWTNCSWRLWWKRWMLCSLLYSFTFQWSCLLAYDTFWVTSQGNARYTSYWQKQIFSFGFGCHLISVCLVPFDFAFYFPRDLNETFFITSRDTDETDNLWFHYNNGSPSLVPFMISLNNSMMLWVKNSHISYFGHVKCCKCLVINIY